MCVCAYASGNVRRRLVIIRESPPSHNIPDNGTNARKYEYHDDLAVHQRTRSMSPALSSYRQSSVHPYIYYSLRPYSQCSFVSRPSLPSLN